jgi:peptidoglycan hydrolase-like protein with peptidoglycan-binding domain
LYSDARDPLRLIQSGLDKLGYSSGAIDGLWGLRTARAMKALLAANGRAAQHKVKAFT